MRIWFKKHWGLFLVILLSWWVIKPLFHQGFFPMHDDTQVVRVAQMAKALREGQFPVRWVSDLGYGYGYPLFNFYAPLPYYVGAFWELLGLDSLTATKFMFGIGIILAGIFMYFLTKEFFGERGAVLSAILYQYAPYHALDIYVRGAVGEFWAAAFIPLVFYGFYKTINASKSKWILIGGIGYTGVILSHNITAMLLTGFIFIAPLFHCLIVLLRRKKFIIHYSLFIILMGLGLSAFFWLPALGEMKYTNISAMIEKESNFGQHFLYLDQLWDSSWGFAGSAPGRADGMSFKIGKLHLILAVLGLGATLYTRKRKKIANIFLSFYLSIFMLLFFLIFMTTEYSKFIWEAVSPLSYVQYPWRFLVFIIFAVSFLGGGLTLASQFLTKNRLCRILSRMDTLIVAVLIILTIMINGKYFQPQKSLALKVDDYINEENIKWDTSKISDEYLPKNFPKPEIKAEVVKEKVVLEESVRLVSQEVKSHRYALVVDSRENHNVLIRTVYFPGWEVLIDDKRVEFTVSNGQILISIPSGRHDIMIKFTNTVVRTLGNLISLATLIVLAALMNYLHRKKQKYMYK